MFAGTWSAAPLGGHLKTGHRWTLQNRPTEQNQNKSIYTSLEGGCANSFWRHRPGEFILTVIWAEDTPTQGCDRSDDPAAGMAGRRKPPFSKILAQKAINPNS